MAELGALYATALFELAMADGVVDELFEQAKSLRDVLQDEDCRRVLVHPHITDSEKREFFASAFGNQFHDYLISLMHLTIDKNREAYLIPALTALIEKVERFQKKIVADVTSASELDTKQVATLKDELSKKLDKKVELSVKVDPSLIGGPYIRVGGYLMDLTVKMRLHELSAGMKEGWGV